MIILISTDEKLTQKSVSIANHISFCLAPEIHPILSNFLDTEAIYDEVPPQAHMSSLTVQRLHQNDRRNTCSKVAAVLSKIQVSMMIRLMQTFPTQFKIQLFPHSTARWGWHPRSTWTCASFKRGCLHEWRLHFWLKLDFINSCLMSCCFDGSTLDRPQKANLESSSSTKTPQERTPSFSWSQISYSNDTNESSGRFVFSSIFVLTKTFLCRSWYSWIQLIISDGFFHPIIYLVYFSYLFFAQLLLSTVRTYSISAPLPQCDPFNPTSSLMIFIIFASFCDGSLFYRSNDAKDSYD